MLKNKLGFYVLLSIFIFTSCVSIEPPKVPPLNYKVIQFSELSEAINQVSYAGNGFIIEDAYNFEQGGAFCRFYNSPGGTPSEWFEIHIEGNIDPEKYSFSVPYQFTFFNQNTINRFEKNKAYRVYIGVYFDSYARRWTAIIDRVEGLMSEEEAIVYQQNLLADKEANDVKQKTERSFALDNIARSIANGYIYHGVTEDSQSRTLFTNGALEPGHAYFISGFLIGNEGITGGVVTSLFVEPTYHVVDFINQTVKGQVIEASQGLLGTLPVSIVVVGGKPPLHIPLVIGFVE